MATADKVVVELQARTDAYIAGITKADAEFTAKVGHMEKEANELANAVNRAGQRSGQAFTKIASDAPRAANAIKGMAGQTGNLAAQINDIGVQLAGGQSPFLIAIQQGSQINQVLGGMGAAGAVRSLAGAFTSMLNPVSLATFAIIGLGGAAISYIADFLSGNEKVELTLEQQEKLIRKVADRWGDAVPALKAYVDQLDRAAELEELSTAQNVAAERQYDKVRDKLEGVSVQFANVIGLLRELGVEDRVIAEMQEAFNKFSAEVSNSTSDGKDAVDIYQRLTAQFTKFGVPAVGDLADEFKRLADEVSAASAAAGNFRVPPVEFGGTGGSNRYRARFRPGEFSTNDLPGTNNFPGRMGVDDAGVFGDFRGSSKDFIRRQAVAGVRDRVEMLDDAFADGLARLLSEYPDLKVTSAYRTTAQQAAIYNSGVRPAAKPGRSLHEKGLAADLSRSDAAIRARARELGLYFPLPGTDPGHVQLAGAQGGRGGGGTAPGMGLHTDPLAAFREDPWAGLREKTTGQITLNKELQASYDALAQVGVTAINGIANALADGKIEGEELLQIVLQIVQQLLTMPRLPSGTGGAGGIFGGLLIPGILHKGGIAGRDGYGSGRAVSPSVFAGANRMHGGGMAGLRSGEVPAILQRGEMVIPAKDGGSGGGRITLHVIGEPGPEFAPRIRAEAQGVSVRVMSAYDKSLNRSFGDRMTNATARQR